MEVIVALISGFFSLAAIWYQNYLQKKAPVDYKKQDLPGAIVGNQTTTQTKSPALRIIFTLVIVILPYVLLAVLGKTEYAGAIPGREYYFIWIIITLAAILIGWIRKSLFEKIVLIASLLFLIYTIAEIYIRTNNENNRIEQIRSGAGGDKK